jgi:predicted HicB family RNase H-like nuclease
MGTITVRLSDEAHQRIKELANSRNISLNKLYEEFTITSPLP